MSLTFEEIKTNALKKATLVEALSYASMMDTERAVLQAINNKHFNKMANQDTGALWETMSDYMFKEIAVAWEIKEAELKSLALVDLAGKAFKEVLVLEEIARTTHQEILSEIETFKNRFGDIPDPKNHLQSITKHLEELIASFDQFKHKRLLK